MANSENRVVFLHYHLFKNAGTSIDEILKDSFPGQWTTREFHYGGQRERHLQEVTDWIVGNPEMIAFSSHTCEFPPPEIPGVKILPVIFVRDPLDRIVSAYKFEKLQQDSGFGSTLARNTKLSGYVEVQLAFQHDRQCRNFHTARFARYLDDHNQSELDRAMFALNALPFVGVVHKFSQSLSALEKLVRNYFPDFEAREVHVNITSDPKSELAQRLEAARVEMGDALYGRLREVNENDYALIDAAIKKLELS